MWVWIRNVSPEDRDSYWSKYYTDDTIQEFGYNALNDQIVPKTTKDMMSIAPQAGFHRCISKSCSRPNSVPPETAGQAPQADQAFLMVGGSRDPGRAGDL